MNLRRVENQVPEAMVPFVLMADNETQLEQNAMLLYPHIQRGTISHGKAAEILGIHKLDLIALYGKLGLDYMNVSKEELEEDLQTIKKVREG